MLSIFCLKSEHFHLIAVRLVAAVCVTGDKEKRYDADIRRI